MQRRSFLQALGLLCGTAATGLPVLADEFKEAPPLQVNIEPEFKWEIPPLGWARKYSRLMLLNNANYIVKEELAEPGHWITRSSDREITDFGPTILVTPLSIHPKAVHFPENKPPIEYYSYGSKHFNKIMDDAEDESIEYFERWRNQFGLEFFLGLPETKQIVTFFCGTRTLKRFAHSMFMAGHLKEQRPITLGSKKLSTSKFSWYAPTSECHNPTFPFAPIDLTELNHASTDLGEGKREVHLPVLRRAFEGNLKGTRKVRI